MRGELLLHLAFLIRLGVLFYVLAHVAEFLMIWLYERRYYG